MTIQKVKRYFKAPKHESYFLFGPTGTGKSTWLKEHYSDGVMLNLLDPEELRFYLAKPERLKELILAYPEKK